MSFSLLAVRRVRALAPRLPTVLLMDLPPRWLRRGHLPFGTRIAGPNVELLRTRPWLVPALRAAATSVRLDGQRTGRSRPGLAAGVDGLITDRPAHTLARLGR
ncbi:hypothetical protein [Micromonospora yangpuensis]|uniref:hypothetical protein n=1 Tax=Micromonospora yangpuensis TaxID=683228 RepID=UPI000A88F7D5